MRRSANRWMNRTTRGQVSGGHAGFEAEGLEARQLLSSSISQTGTSIASPLGTEVSSTVVVDFDGDGVRDVVIAQGIDVSWLRGLGGGQFAEQRSLFRFEVSAGFLAVADMNDDGRPDIIALQRGAGTSSALRVLTNQGSDGTGGYRFSRTSVRVPLQGESLTVADFVAGRRPEIVVTGQRVQVATVIMDVADELRMYTLTPGGQIRDWGALFSARNLTAPALVAGSKRFAIGAQNPDRDNPWTSQLFTSEIGRSDVPGFFFLTYNTKFIDGVAQSVAIGEMNGDRFLDAVVTVERDDFRNADLAYPIRSFYTLAFAGLGPIGSGFSNPETVDRQQFAAASRDRSTNVSYRIQGLGDFNGDLRTDIGLTVVTDTVIEFGPTDPPVMPRIRSGEFSQIINRADGFQRYQTHEVQGIPAVDIEMAPLFTLADVRGTGRMDLITSDPPGLTERGEFKLYRNTTNFKGPSIELKSIEGLIFDGGNTSAAFGSQLGITVETRTAETVRGRFVASARAYVDRNNNGIVDSADFDLGLLSQPGRGNAPTNLSGRVTFSGPLGVDQNWGSGRVRLLVIATDNEGLSSKTLMSTEFDILLPPI